MPEENNCRRVIDASFAEEREREGNRRREKPACHNCSCADTCEFPNRLVCLNTLSKYCYQFVDSNKDFIGEECIEKSLYTPGATLVKWSVHSLQTDERKWAFEDNTKFILDGVWVNKKEYIEYLERK